MKNVYKTLSKAEVGCTMKINRWLVGRIAAICNACGVKFKVDDESVDYKNDTIIGVVAADSPEAYVAAAQDVHNEMGLDFA